MKHEYNDVTLRRVELHDILRGILESNNVYFQPPESVKLVYPCIIYQLSDRYDFHADNRLYAGKKQYTVTIIDRNPDSPYPDKLILLPYCSFDQYFASDNLNHYVFTLYF